MITTWWYIFFCGPIAESSAVEEAFDVSSLANSLSADIMILCPIFGV